MMHDRPKETDEKEESKYECLKCGNIMVAASHPGDCEGCGGGMVGREVSLE